MTIRRASTRERARYSPAPGQHDLCLRDFQRQPAAIEPGAVAPDPGAIERLERICTAASPALASAKIVARQACFRPIAADGLPLIGRVPGIEGAYVATGHSVRGILNAPATGEAMAELILDGVARTIDLAPFNPGRLRPLDPARLQLLRAS